MTAIEEHGLRLSNRRQSTAWHNAAFQVFLLQRPNAWNEAYNICDNESGDPYTELWPKLAG